MNQARHERSIRFDETISHSLQHGGLSGTERHLDFKRTKLLPLRVHDAVQTAEFRFEAGRLVLGMLRSATKHGLFFDGGRDRGVRSD